MCIETDMDTTLFNYYHYYYWNISKTTGLYISQVKVTPITCYYYWGYKHSGMTNTKTKLTRLFMSKKCCNLCYIPCWLEKMCVCYKCFCNLMLMRHISQTLRFLKRHCDVHVEEETNKVHTFFINDLIQLYCFQHVSNNSAHQEVCTSSFTVFYHACKQSSRWQDVFDPQTHPASV
jgi:hypothetical protein